MWGAKLSTIQTERKSPWNWDVENLKVVWAAKNLTPPTHGSPSSAYPVVSANHKL
jgi:hypothetical protein